MKFSTLSRRAAAAGASSALVAFPVVLDSDAPGIENIPGAAAGFRVPAQLLTVTNVFTIPSSVRDTLIGIRGREPLPSPTSRHGGLLRDPGRGDGGDGVGHDRQRQRHLLIGPR